MCEKRCRNETTGEHDVSLVLLQKGKIGMLSKFLYPVAITILIATNGLFLFKLSCGKGEEKKNEAKSTSNDTNETLPFTTHKIRPYPDSLDLLLFGEDNFSRDYENEKKYTINVASQGIDDMFPYSFDSLDELIRFAAKDSEFVAGKFAPGTVQEWNIGGYRTYTCHRVYGSSGCLQDLAIYAHQGGGKLKLFLSLPITWGMSLEMEQSPNQILEVYRWNKVSGKRDLFLVVCQVP